MGSTNEGQGKREKEGHWTKPKTPNVVDSGLSHGVETLALGLFPKLPQLDKGGVPPPGTSGSLHWALNGVSWLCPLLHLARCRVPVECHSSDGLDAKEKPPVIDSKLHRQP